MDGVDPRRADITSRTTATTGSSALSPQLVRLRPAPHCRTPILSYSLRVEPAGHFVNWQQDPQSNYVARLTFPEQVRELRIEVDLVAEMAVYNPFDFFLEPHAEQSAVRLRPTGSCSELQPFLPPRAADAALRRLPRVDPAGERRRTIDFLVDLNQRLQRRHPLRDPPRPGRADARRRRSTLGRGSCRDSTWLLVQLLRHLGLAARFVSGYLIQLVAGRHAARRSARARAATSPICTPGARSTCPAPAGSASIRRRACSPAKGTSRSSCTPEPASAAPVTGAVDECEVAFEHHDGGAAHPRVAARHQAVLATTQWHAIVDARASRRPRPAARRRAPDDGRRADVRVDRRSRRRRVEHRRRSARPSGCSPPICCGACGGTSAPAGFVHFGQGKWYPGEQLPRWALGCYWRADGEPAWRDAVARSPTSGVDYGCRRRRRRALPARARRPARRHRRARAGRLRGRLVLPVARAAAAGQRRSVRRAARRRARARAAAPRLHAAGSTRSSATPCRSRAPSDRAALADRARGSCATSGMYLMPGDSPMGYRLPLDSLPWVSERRLSVPARARPDGARAPPLPAPTASAPRATRGARRAAGAVAAAGATADRRPARRVGAPGSSARRSAPRRATACSTSSCRRCRRLEDYLELVAAVEATAAALGMPVLLEGYPPPADPRLAHFQITPDPGVIEVNIQPATRWDELVEQTTTLYEEARQSRLTTEKFMLDGRHTGTGGGNHFVLGGATPADSPFLRRPDLLRSLVAYWHNHPSLSYLLLGPVHRPDEPGAARRRGAPRQRLRARDRLRAAPRAPTAPFRPGWSIALFRHLLVDVTGNTHRAEFCIDKLYSPDSVGGPPRPARAARVRDAAARAHEPGAAAAAARAGRALLARAVRRRR